MSVQLASILNGQQFFDNDGKPLNGGLIFVYSSGTSTPVNTWSNAAGSVLNTNPLTLDSSGRLQTEIWLSASTQVTFRLTDSEETALGQWDNIAGILSGLTITQSDVLTALGYVPVNVAGDTMLGQLTLAGAPSTNLMAATKKYVDDAIAAFQVILDAALAAAVQITPGQMIPYAAITPPTGFLVCDGTPVSRTTYAPLFAVVGTSFGTGDGSTTFNLPDMRGRFMRGYDNGAGNDPSRVFGSYQRDDFLKHDHITYVPNDGHWNDGLTKYDPQYTGGVSHPQWTIIGDKGDSSNTFLIVTDTESQIPQPSIHPGIETVPKNVCIQYIIKT